jgi:hypothetical protein
MVDNLSKAIEDETYQCKIPSNYKVKVTTQHPDTYRTLIRHLHSEHTIHHTYQMKHDTAYRVVIQDLHYSIPITDIKDELQKLGHPVRNIINIRHRVHKYPLSMFYVDLEPMSNNKEIYDLQFIHNMKITVEPLTKEIPFSNAHVANCMATPNHTAPGLTNVSNVEVTT